MSRKKYFLLIDTETTQTDKVIDFGALIVDKAGLIHKEAGCLISPYYRDRDNHPLFYRKDACNLWAKRNLPKRYENYDNMIKDGRRMIATVSAINRWLARAAQTYSPTVTAYNLSFDLNKCRNTGIDLDIFSNRFCLWHAAAMTWAHTKAFRKFIIDNHAFNPPTSHGNMSFKTNADIMARFILNDPNLEEEPHTALEDARDYELPILQKLVKRARAKDYMAAEPYSWQKWQVKDWFKPA